MSECHQQIIAHRGASGYLPENTLAAAELAHRQGADWIECDVVMTKDEEVLVLHDLELDLVTDVAEKFSGRARADGMHYAIDFTLDELRTLGSGERLDRETRQPQYVGRFAAPPEKQPLMTLEEFILLVQRLNHESGREVGICVELKGPLFHDKEGKDLTARAFEILCRHGYTEPDSRCVLMSFEPVVVERLRHELGWRPPLLQLIGMAHWGEGDFDYASLVTPEGLAKIATYADWIGPHISQVMTINPNEPLAATGLIEAAHACGLRVASYTFQHEGMAAGHTLDGLLDFALGPLGLDRPISDFPDVAVAALKRMHG